MPKYTLVASFMNGAQYPIELSENLRHYGNLTGQIVGVLEDSFVRPLPNPTHLVLKAEDGSLITSDNLWERKLSYFLPQKGACLYVGKTSWGSSFKKALSDICSVKLR